MSSGGHALPQTSPASAVPWSEPQASATSSSPKRTPHSVGAAAQELSVAHVLACGWHVTDTQPTQNKGHQRGLSKDAEITGTEAQGQPPISPCSLVPAGSLQSFCCPERDPSRVSIPLSRTRPVRWQSAATLCSCQVHCRMHSLGTGRPGPRPGSTTTCSGTWRKGLHC